MARHSAVVSVVHEGDSVDVRVACPRCGMVRSWSAGAHRAEGCRGALMEMFDASDCDVELARLVLAS